MSLKRVLTGALVAVIAVLALAACSDDTDKVGGGAPSTGPTVPLQIQEQPAVAQPLDEALSVAIDGVIEVAAADTRYSPNKLSLTAGESVTIRVTNSDSVSHNLRIAGLDGQYDTEDDAVTAPQTIASGESGELNFAPLAPGSYTFHCDFHPARMGGQIIVRPAAGG